jgi:hypothetical protein
VAQYSFSLAFDAATGIINQKLDNNTVTFWLAVVCRGFSSVPWLAVSYGD